MSVTPAPKNWACPKCRRKFARPRQRHICGSGTRAEVLKNRREEVVKLFEALETHVRTFGPVEFVPRMVRHPLFKKIVADRRWVSHMAKVRNLLELEQMKPFLRAAWDYSETY